MVAGSSRSSLDACRRSRKRTLDDEGKDGRHHVRSGKRHRVEAMVKMEPGRENMENQSTSGDKHMGPRTSVPQPMRLTEKEFHAQRRMPMLLPQPVMPYPLEPMPFSKDGHTHGRRAMVKSENEVENGAWRKDPHEKILKLDKEEISERDVEFLNDGRMLNDSILNFMIKLAEVILTPECVHLPSNFFSFTSHFFTRLTMASDNGKVGHENVQTWTKKLRQEGEAGIFGRKYICAPVHDKKRVHWVLAILIDPGHCCRREPQCHFLQDLEVTPSEVFAMGQENNGGVRKGNRTDVGAPAATKEPCPDLRTHEGPYVLLLDSAAKQQAHSRRSDRKLDHIAKSLKKYLKKEWEFSGNSPDLFQKKSIKVVKIDVPKQENSYDCGIFVLEYMLRFMSDPNFLERVLRPQSTWRVFGFEQRDVTQRRNDLRQVSRRMFKIAKRHNIQDTRELIRRCPKIKNDLVALFTQK